MLAESLVIAQSVTSTGGAPGRGEPASSRIEWLVANPDHVAFSEILSELLDDANSITDLNVIRRRVIPVVATQDLRWAYSRVLATIYRTARQLNAAAEMFGQAYEASSGTDVESLFAHAQLLYELGELGQSDIEAREIVSRTTDYDLKRRSYTLAARIAHALGYTSKALEMLETLASLANSDDSDSDFVDVETLSLMRQIHQISGDSSGVERVDALIERVFPDSVVADIATSASRQLVLPGLPSALQLPEVAYRDDLSRETGEDLEGAAESPRRDRPGVSAVQVGSFSEADNARHLAEDLQRLGLDARSEALFREGSLLYQVVVEIPAGSNQNAERILGVLRESGFDGIRIY